MAGSPIGRIYLEKGQPVTMLITWSGKGPHNVMIQRSDGSVVVRPMRGLRRAPVDIPASQPCE